MIPRCVVCGNLSTNSRSLFPLSRKLYCSKTCLLIATQRRHLSVAVFSITLTLVGVISLLYFILSGDDLTMIFAPIFLFVIGTIASSHPLSQYIKGRKLAKERFFESENRIYSCIFCNNKYDNRLSGTPTTCQNCGKESPFCDICSKYIFAGQPVYQLQDCGHIFHKTDLRFYLENEEKCPKCKQKISSILFEIK